MTLTEGETVLLGPDGLPVPAIVAEQLQKGVTLLMDDGKLLLEMLDSVHARVLRGGLLQGGKSIALPGMTLRTPALTPVDLENLRHAASLGVTGVMQPFVRDAEDLRQVRRAMEEAGCGQLKLLAKIEDLNGVRHLKDFFPLADEIVIARGDLGNAVPLWQLPAVQKSIAAACRDAGMPFMVVTQMLASMEHHAVPTRAEVSDIANAVLDGASSVMVTGETAVGDYPAEVIRYLAMTVRETRRWQQEGSSWN